MKGNLVAPKAAMKAVKKAARRALWEKEATVDKRTAKTSPTTTKILGKRAWNPRTGKPKGSGWRSKLAK